MNTNMKKKVIIGLVLMAVAVVVWFLLRGGTNVPSDAKTRNLPKVAKVKSHKRLGKRSDGGTTKARREIDAAVERIANVNSSMKRGLRISHPSDIESNWVDEDGNPWPEDQKNLMRSIVKAAEDEDFASVAALAKDVMKSENAELREQYIEELGWFGEQALVELMPFLSDPNEDVADAARSQITDAFQEIDADADKAAAYTVLSRAVIDKEMLESLSDELVAMDEVIALQAIVDTINDGTPNAQEAAKAAYKEITDEDWTGIDAAENWLKDNYVDDDDDPSDEPTGSVKPETVGDGAASRDGVGKDDEN